MSQPPTQNSQGQMDNASLQLILEAINRTNIHINEIKTDLSARIETLDGKFNNLSEAFLPRREANEAFQGVRDQLSEHKARITAVEEWRLAQSEKIADARMDAQNGTANDRKEIDTRTITLIWGICMLAANILISLVITRLFH